MHQRVAAVIGAVATIGLFALTNAKRLADAISIVHLPHDVGEFLTAMSAVPTLISYGALAIGVVCVAYLVLSTRKPKARSKLFASIEFRFMQGESLIINAIVTPAYDLKNLVLLGTFAAAVYYEDGSVRWVWEPSIRLLKTDDVFKGEIIQAQVVNCNRADPSQSPMIFFSEKPVPVYDDQLYLFRVTTICDSGTMILQRPYRQRRLDYANLFDPVRSEEINYVQGAREGLD